MTETKKNKMVFRDYYDSLTSEEKTHVRDMIIDKSGMSYTTFYYKLRHESFKPLEIELIQNCILLQSKNGTEKY